MTDKTDKIIATALERFKRCEDAESEIRNQALEELKFSLGEQWPEEIRRARETDPNGARPCLTVDKLDQYIRQVVNDARQNKPAIKPRPKDDGADVETAEVLQGLCRQIEDHSNADVAYDIAVEMAARAGFGFIRVVTDYADDEGFEQDLFIRAVKNPFSCHLDPDHNNPDGSDAQYGFAFDDMPREQFDREYPDADPCDFDTAAPEQAGWLRENLVRVAEYFECVYEDKTVYQGEDGKPSEREIPKALKRMVRRKKIVWRKITAKEVLEEREWLGKYIPIVPVYGHLIDVAGEKRISSMHRPAMDAMRLYNYAASAFAERVALTPKAPYIATAGQIEGYEDQWAAANTSNAAVLPYNPDPQAPPPQRQQAADVPTGWMQVMQNMEHDIQSALGMYNASLGAPGNEKSGKAIRERKLEADNATFHITDNLSRAIRHVGRILIDLIPKIYDTARVVRIIGEDGSEDFARIDPEQEESRREIRDLQGKVIERIYNPGVGKYDVTVTVGPAYGTKRQEAAEFITQIVQSSPDMMPIIGDLMFKSLDMPFAQDIAERLKKMMPPQLQDQEDEGAPQIPPQVQMQMQQMSEAFGQTQQIAEQLQQELAQAQQQLKDKAGEREIKAAELQIKAAEMQTKSREVAIKEGELQLKAIELKKPKDEPGAEPQTLAAIEQLAASLDQAMQQHEQHMQMMAEAMAGLSQRINQPKTISLMSPSGRQYVATSDGESVQVQSPSGVYSGSIQQEHV